MEKTMRELILEYEEMREITLQDETKKVAFMSMLAHALDRGDSYFFHYTYSKITSQVTRDYRKLFDSSGRSVMD
ncbi:hypothetical protein JW796_03825 [Candidatus Dojkabacteria bacterium]|nr:hypothetical protein [Candidatus Dojkabacteria bacterium]